MADLSLYILIGRLTRDAEVKSVPSGKSVTQFTIASNPSWNREDPALFMECQMWGERGVKVADYLRRGTKVNAVGTLKQESWVGTDGQKKNRYRLDVSDIGLLDSRKDESAIPATQEASLAHGIPALSVSQMAAVFGARPEKAQSFPIAAAKATADGFEDDIPF
jgi:single-strand DNA-binding protein